MAEQPVTIATVNDLREFWTSTLQDGGQDMKDLLKASEILGKRFGLFTEKRSHSGSMTIQVVYGGEYRCRGAPAKVPPRPASDRHECQALRGGLHWTAARQDQDGEAPAH